MDIVGGISHGVEKNSVCHVSLNNITLSFSG